MLRQGVKLGLHFFGSVSENIHSAVFHCSTVTLFLKQPTLFLYTHKCNWRYTHKKIYTFFPEFYETHKFSTALRADLLEY